MKAIATINPHLAARLQTRPAAPRPVPKRKPVYAKLPLAPITASPVPELTSLYHNSRAGEYGDRGYAGNCSGNLIKDLLRFFKPSSVLDPLCCQTHKGSCVAKLIMWPRLPFT